MKGFVRIMHDLFVLTLHLYPKGFRLQFGDEMATVFRASLEDASEQGAEVLLACLFREFRDGLSFMFTQLWGEALYRFQSNIKLSLDHAQNLLARGYGSGDMSESDSFRALFRKNRWFAIIAAAPPLLFGLGVGVDSLIRGGPWNTIPAWRLYLGIGVGLIPMLIIAVVGLYALSKRMPIWGLTWIGSGYMGLLFLVKTASEELADEGKYIISQSADIVLVVLILVAGVTLLGYAALQGWRRAALFSIGMATVFCLSLYLSVTSAPFYRHDLALFAAPVGLLLSLLTYVYIVGSDRMRILSFLAIALLNLSPVLVTNNTWRDWLLRENRPSLAIPLMVLLMASLLSGPIMGVILSPLQKIIKRAH